MKRDGFEEALDMNLHVDMMNAVIEETFTLFFYDEDGKF